MKSIKLFFVPMIVVMITSCGGNSPAAKNDSVAVSTKVDEPYYPMTRREADSMNSYNWVDAKGYRQGWWKITGAMDKNNAYAPDAIVEEGAYYYNWKSGWWKTYTPNGSLKDSSYCYGTNDSLNCVDANRMWQGHWIITGSMEPGYQYRADAKVREGIFRNGKRVGVWTYYKTNGTIGHYQTFTNDSLFNEGDSLFDHSTPHSHR